MLDLNHLQLSACNIGQCSKGTHERDYSGLLKYMGANEHRNRHGIIKGPVEEVLGTETFDVYLYAQYTLCQCNHGCYSRRNKL